jgi:recombination protein RecR
VKSFQKLVSSLKRLPGIGPKQAERLAIFLLRAPTFETDNLINALREAKAAVRACRVCFDFTEGEVCRLCADPGRDHSQVCVVEEPQDVTAIERCRAFRGVYHVLHGSLSPLDGIGPEGLRIRELLERLKAADSPVTEIILATDPDTEGDATALYLSQLLSANPKVRTTRIAHGVPMGGDLDYIDERTLSQALTGRQKFSAS